MSTGPGRDEAPDFVVWFRANHGWILRRAYSFTRDPVLAEDIAQDAVVKIFKAWKREDQRECILGSRAYVRKVVRNCYFDYLRRPSRTREYESELDEETYRDRRVADVSDRDLHDALERLSDDEREMLFLVYHDHWKIRDAGYELGYPPGKAYRLHTKAKRHLTELLR